MKTYKIIWQSIMFGDSKVYDKNKKEAKRRAYDRLDFDWNRFELNSKWFISKIEIIKEADHETPA